MWLSHHSVFVKLSLLILLHKQNTQTYRHACAHVSSADVLCPCEWIFPFWPHVSDQIRNAITSSTVPLQISVAYSSLLLFLLLVFNLQHSDVSPHFCSNFLGLLVLRKEFGWHAFVVFVFLFLEVKPQKQIRWNSATICFKVTQLVITKWRNKIDSSRAWNSFQV